MYLPAMLLGAVLPFLVAALWLTHLLVSAHGGAARELAGPACMLGIMLFKAFSALSNSYILFEDGCAPFSGF